MIDQRLKRDSLWTYKGQDYRILVEPRGDELTQDAELDQWSPNVRYTTRNWTGLKFNRASTEFLRKFKPLTEVKPPKLTNDELLVVMGLRDNDAPEEGWFYTFRSLQRFSGIPEDHIRRVIRSLARKGILEFRRGLMTEDGECAGSGYGFSKEGREYAKTLP